VEIGSCQQTVNCIRDSRGHKHILRNCEEDLGMRKVSTKVVSDDQNNFIY
jgi:hypothetical protein